MSLSLLLDLIFPKTCLSCNALGSYICKKCKKNLHVTEKDICAYCKKGSYLGMTHPKCVRKHGLDSLQSIYHYSPEFQKIIKGVKYRCLRSLMRDIFQIVPHTKLRCLSKNPNYSDECILIPVPLHSNRERVRGFNQSVIIAHNFSNILNLNIDALLIDRKKDTPPQAQLLSAGERYHNIRGAFSLIKQNVPQKAIIIDDVWTSGSTVKEIARVLKKHGVKKVFAITLAR